MVEISRQSAGYKYNLKYSTSVVYSNGGGSKIFFAAMPLNALGLLNLQVGANE
jgi:hypothetical protein